MKPQQDTCTASLQQPLLPDEQGDSTLVVLLHAKASVAAWHRPCCWLLMLLWCLSSNTVLFLVCPALKSASFGFGADASVLTGSIGFMCGVLYFACWRAVSADVLEFGAHLRLMSNGGIITFCLDVCILVSRLVTVAAGCAPWSWSCAFTTLLNDWMIALVVASHGLLSIAVAIKADKLMPVQGVSAPDLQVVV